MPVYLPGLLRTKALFLSYHFAELAGRITSLFGENIGETAAAFVAHFPGDVSYGAAGAGQQNFCLIDPHVNDVFKKRHACFPFEHVRKVVGVQIYQVSHLLQRKFFPDVIIDIVLDSVHSGVFGRFCHIFMAED